METKGFLFPEISTSDREPRNHCQKKNNAVVSQINTCLKSFFCPLRRKYTAHHPLDNLWWPDLAQHFLLLCVSVEPAPQAGSDPSYLSEMASESVARGADVSVALAVCSSEEQLCLEREERAEWLDKLLVPQTSCHHSVTKKTNKNELA